MPQDVEAVYALKVAAFGATSLPFTIYRSPKSIAYLRALVLEASSTDTRLRIKVLSQEESLLGYYHAVPSNDSFFLNYLAVNAQARGAGLGTKLLLDFESEARNLGFHSTALDVLASNSRGMGWYLRHGYCRDTAHYHIRLDLSAITKTQNGIRWSNADWRRAQEEEQRQGFSKFEARYGNYDLELGLIDGCAAKLLSWPGGVLDECISAVAHMFAGTRTELIVSGLAAIPTGWPILSAEQALRLRRELPREIGDSDV